MLTLADVEALMRAGEGPKGTGGSEGYALIETDKGFLSVWKPGSFDSYIELRLSTKGFNGRHYFLDAFEAQCRIIGWDLTLKETG